MNRLILITLLFLSFNLQAKGSSGSYYIEGTVYSAANNILSNALITVDHNGVQTDYYTDEKGRVKIKINWISPCKSAVPTEMWNKIEEESNPQWIHVYFKCQGAKIENQWKKYAGIYPESSKSNIRYLDIHFKN